MGVEVVTEVSVSDFAVRPYEVGEAAELTRRWTCFCRPTNVLVWLGSGHDGKYRSTTTRGKVGGYHQFNLCPSARKLTIDSYDHYRTIMQRQIDHLTNDNDSLRQELIDLRQRVSGTLFERIGFSLTRPLLNACSSEYLSLISSV